MRLLQEEEPAWEQIVAEWAAEEAHNEEFTGAPEILSPPRFPRLRGKQAPTGEWLRVAEGPYGKEVLQALRAQEAEEARQHDAPAAAMDVEPPEAEGHAEPAPKKPRKDSRICPGRSRNRPCLFAQSEDRLGQAARLHEGNARCQFCDAKSLTEAVKAPQRKKHITLALRKWQEAGRQDIFDAAMALIPEDARPSFLQALKRPSRAAPAVEARAKAKAEADKEERTKAWEQRQWLGGAFSNEEQRAYRQKTLDDERRMRSKFGPLQAAQAAEDATWLSERAKCFEVWCTKDSWGVCGHCHRLVKRSLHENNITGKKPPSLLVQGCGHCKKGTGYPTVAHEDIPKELQNLSDAVLWALQPLRPDVGFEACARHGYRVHTDMIRFWWNEYPVAEQIEWLEDPADKQAARAAYRYLMAAEESSYKKFVDFHNRFLHRNAADIAKDEQKLRLPRRVLEEEGIECAVWPHLYPRTNMCETYVRKQDARRLERAAAAAPAASAPPAAAPTGAKAANKDAARPRSTSSTSSTSSTTSSSSSSTSTSSSTTSEARTVFV